MKRHLSFFWPVYLMGLVFIGTCVQSYRVSEPTWTTPEQRCITTSLCIPGGGL